MLKPLIILGAGLVLTLSVACDSGLGGSLGSSGSRDCAPVTADSLINDYLVDGIQAIADWEGECVNVTVPHITRFSKGLGLYGNPPSYSAYTETEFGKLSLEFSSIDDLNDYRDALQAVCEVGPVGYSPFKKLPSISLQECR